MSNFKIQGGLDPLSPLPAPVTPGFTRMQDTVKQAWI